jgi:ABC-2 type transport system permease protein
VSAAATIRLIAEREIRVRIRARAFVIFTIVQLVAVVAIVLVTGLTSGSGRSVYHVAYAGAHPELDLLGPRIAPQAQTPARATRELRDGKVDAALLDGRLYTGPKSPGTLVALIEAAHRDVEVRAALARANVPPAVAGAVLAPPPLARTRVAGAHQAPDGARALSAIGAVLLYVALLGAGAMVASGVVEEKTSRVVEIILGTTSPRQLLAGKVLGVGLLSLGQLLLVVVAGLAAAVPVGVAKLPHATVGVAALLVLWFVLGYALFACAFAAVGSLVSRQEDLASAQIPLMVVLGIGYFVSLGLSDPDAPLAVILTFVPPLAPTVVPARAALGHLPLWQLALSVLVSAGSTFLLIRVAARLYSDGVLRTGAPLRLTRALRELRRA